MTMTPEEFQEAQLRLGLSDSELGFVLGVDRLTINRYKRDPSTPSSRKPSPIAGEAMRWMTEDGYEPPRLRWLRAGNRPQDWPANQQETR